MRVVLVRTPDNGQYRDELSIFCSYAGLPVVVLGCIRSSCWQKGSSKDLKTTQAGARTVAHSPKTNSKDVLQRMIFTRRCKCGDCLEPSNLCSSSFGVERYFLCDGMRKLDTKPDFKTLTYNLSCCWGYSGSYRTCVYGKPVSGLTWGPWQKRESMPNTAWMNRNQGLDSSET